MAKHVPIENSHFGQKGPFVSRFYRRHYPFLTNRYFFNTIAGTFVFYNLTIPFLSVRCFRIPVKMGHTSQSHNII